MAKVSNERHSHSHAATEAEPTIKSTRALDLYIIEYCRIKDGSAHVLPSLRVSLARGRAETLSQNRVYGYAQGTFEMSDFVVFTCARLTTHTPKCVYSIPYKTRFVIHVLTLTIL